MVSFLHEDLTSLYKLIERLLHLYGNEETQIVASKLPTIFPNDIPFPSGATIIGSIVHDDDWRDERIQVFFDVSFQLEQLNNFYEENLGTNWNRKEEEFRGGFTRISNSLSQNLNNICFVDRTKNRELYINPIHTEKESQQGNMIMVSLELEQRSDSTIPLAPIPILLSPPNVQILKSSGGGSEQKYNIDAELKTNLDLQELITHYAACFEQEGWIENDSGKDKNFVWQNWKMTNENNQTWLGLLQLTLLAETGNYLASVRVSQQTNL